MSRRRKTNSATVGTESHFVQLAQWLAMESEAEMQRSAERRRMMTSSAAEKTGESLLDLAIVDQRHGLGGRQLYQLAKRKQSAAMPWHRLKVGSPVIVSEFLPENPDQLNEDDAWHGVVSGKKRDTIEVAISTHLDGNSFRVDLAADEVTRQRQLAAITVVKDSRGRLRQIRNVLMGEHEPEFANNITIDDVAFKTTLNPSQQEAVAHALSANDLAIIHGPPGTGKTTTVVEFIAQAVERGSKVLACAPSNTAVDNLLERLIGLNQKVIRIGHPARVTEELRDFTLDGLVEQSDHMPVIKSMLREAEDLYRKADRYTRHRPAKGEKAELRREAKRLKADARQLERHAIEHILNSADVVCATTTFNEDLIGERRFDLAVIDEACQSTEPGCWIPLLRCDRLVLAGDHQQLPPTVLSKPAAREGFSVSMMERVMNLCGEQTSRLLDTQYRMHDQIMRFSSDTFYEGQLKSDESVSQHLLGDLEHVHSGQSDAEQLILDPVTFVDTAGADWDEELEPDGMSRRNPREAEFILKKADRLIQLGVRPKEIAIIAPYAAQVRLLRSSCLHKQIEIDTVDGFQGREKEAVLITCVRSNREGEIGFLGDARRMNVALTRARRKLFVVGNSATLVTDPFFDRMLKYFESINAYGSIWNDPDYQA